jgi:DNA-binding PadR family transcriptional regulator
MSTEMAQCLNEFVESSSWIYLVLDKFREEGCLSWKPNGGFSITAKGREAVDALVASGHDPKCIQEAVEQLTA